MGLSFSSKLKWALTLSQLSKLSLSRAVICSMKSLSPEIIWNTVFMSGLGRLVAAWK